MRKYASKNDGKELALQEEAMKKASAYVADLARKLDRQPLCCVTTFGCQVNTVHEIEKAA